MERRDKTLWNAKKDEHTLIGKTLLWAFLIVPTISPANFFLDPKPLDQREVLTSRGMDYYIFLWAIVLSVLLAGFTSPTQFFTVNLSHSCLRLVVALLPVCRIVDIVTYRLYFIFHKSKWLPWRTEYARRSLGIAFANLFETVVAYAILYLLSTEIHNGSGVHLRTRLEAVYFSLVTITTLGYGDYAPIGGLSRAIVMSELMAGFLLLLIIIPALVSLFSQPATSEVDDLRPSATATTSHQGNATHSAEQGSGARPAGPSNASSVEDTGPSGL